MRGKKPMLALAIALLGIAIYLPDWTVNDMVQDDTLGEERIGWGVWGGHACWYDEGEHCRVVDYDDDAVKDIGDSTFPRWCHLALATGILLMAGMAVMVIADRPRPWLRTGVLATAAIAIGSATLAIHARTPSAGIPGSCFPLFVAGAVLGFAITARLEPGSGDPVKPT